jgi:peptidoglycan/LPS O-acetylase OafA/YrhL
MALLCAAVLDRTAEASPRSPRYESLTAWRGLACLLVVVFHSVCAGYGLSFPDGPGALSPLLEVVKRFWVGVPLFFVISGYCVTASADAARCRGNPGVRFFYRRFHRIFPPYWIWLGSMAVGVWVTESLRPGFFGDAHVPNPAGFGAWQWLGNLTLTETWRWHLTHGVESTLLSQSWTLCYEEQFYAVVGLALVLCRSWFFAALAAISGVVLAGAWLLPEWGFSPAGLFLDGKWLMFAAGALVYYAVNYARAIRPVWFCAPLIGGLLWGAAPPGQLMLARINEPNQTYFFAFAFALLLLWLHSHDAAISRHRVLRPLFYCGQMCYSLYLVHWPALIAVSWAVNRMELRNPLLVFLLGVLGGLAFALGLARLFHRLVERRFWNPAYGSGAR